MIIHILVCSRQCPLRPYQFPLKCPTVPIYKLSSHKNLYSHAFQYFRLSKDNFFVPRFQDCLSLPHVLSTFSEWILWLVFPLEPLNREPLTTRYCRIKLKIFSLIERPPRVIMFRKVNKKLFSRPNKPIPTEVISRESRMVTHPNICYYFGMIIDFERDTFLVRDEKTLGCLLSRAPLLAREIHTLAIERLHPFERNYAHFRVAAMARQLGHLEKIILCKEWLEMMQRGGGNFDDDLEMWFWLMTKNADEKDLYLNMSTPTLLWHTPWVYFLPGTYHEPYCAEKELAKWVEIYKY
jgi:hypothetical protein